MPKRVFELAKELGMGAVDLVEGLKSKGFAVRNHMQTLSDQEVEKVLASFAEPSEEGKGKEVKKSAKAKRPKSDSLAKKSGTRRKKTVIRRKTKATAPAAGEQGVTPEQTAGVPRDGEGGPKEALPSQEAERHRDAQGKENFAEDRPRGLQIVESGSKPAPESRPANKGAQDFAGPHPAAKEDGRATKQDKQDKNLSPKKGNRLGSLATMMNERKNYGLRARTIGQERADQELRAYAALGRTGRPIYTTVKKKRAFAGPIKATHITETKEAKRVIKLHLGASAKELAKKLKVKLKEMVDQCLEINLLVKGEDYIGIKLANEIAAFYGHKVENIAFDENAVIGKAELADEEREKWPLRDPIIAIMGHVDHGKTTLLDYIREAKVAAGEAGGITQHIGAYSVHTQAGKRLTFLDTPGHAAFASMRQRGAKVTDIVVLVVAADDGVMPQTEESIRFIKEAGVPVVVAINKMDKEETNPERVKSELAEHGLSPEEWGGDTMMVPISALKGDGIDALLESLGLVAEILNLRAELDGPGEGVVIESKVEAGRGAMATILVQTGTLKKGDFIVAGESFGRARNLMDGLGRILTVAGPSIPVQVLGLNQTPVPGDILNVVKNEREAKRIVQNRIEERQRLESVPKQASVNLEDFFAQAADDQKEQKTLNIMLRADTQGSYEAIKQSLQALSNPEVEVKVLKGGIGPISDSDVHLTSAAQGIVMGFNMRPVTSARRLAEDLAIEIRTYSVIYELIGDVTLALEGMLEPKVAEKYLGRAEVKNTFSIPKVGVIAGSVVVEGLLRVGQKVRLLRNGKIIFDGGMSSLRRFKEDVKEVKSGYECGVGLENFNDVKVGDICECYALEEIKRTLKDLQDESKVVSAPAAAAESEAHQENQIEGGLE